MLYKPICMPKYKGYKHSIRTKKFRLKTSTALTKYFESIYSESHIWLNAGCLARSIGMDEFDCFKTANLVQTIPQAFARGAIHAGYEMKCSHVDYGQHTYPLFSLRPLGKKSVGDTVYFPKCSTPFFLQKGILPDDGIQSYKIVDVTNASDRERQFELHVAVRGHVPPRKTTGVQAGVDLGGKHTAVAVLSDGSVLVLTLRERDTMRKIAKLHAQMSRCKKYSCRYNRLRGKMKSTYKKLSNRQLDKLRKFNNKLMARCDLIIIDGMNLQSMTAEGSGKTEMNKAMRQAKPGAMRQDLAERAPGKNVQYVEANPANTSKECSLCTGANTWRKGRKEKCFACDVMMHADVNGGGNMLYNQNRVEWSKRMQNINKFYDKTGLVLRDRIDLSRRTLPPSAGDWVAGTGGPRQRLAHESLNGCGNGGDQQICKGSLNLCI